MAAIDKQLVMGDGLDVGISIGSVLSTNQIKLIAGKNYKRFAGAATKYADPSDTGNLRLLVKVTDEILSASVSGATLKMDLMSHTTAAVASGTIIVSNTITVTTDRAIGAVLWDIGLPVDVINVTQFFSVNFTVAVQNMASGKLFVALMDGTEKTSEE